MLGRIPARCEGQRHCKAGACKAKDETNRQSACETVDASHPGEEQARQDNDLADSARCLGTDPVYEQAIDQPQNCSGQRWHRDHQASLCRIQAQFLCNRSEEHTSELQSLMRISYAVFCLKKKKRK